jgi:hypothetical protein
MCEHYTACNILSIVVGPGSAHDMRVFNNALSKYAHIFPHPPLGKI